MQQRKRLEEKLKKCSSRRPMIILHENNGSIIARFNLHSCDGGVGSGIATAAIIALRCIREKCEQLLVADEASHDQYKQREWFNQSWDDVLHRHLVHGRQSAGNAQSAMPRSIP
jgi:hypothetical protein